MRFGHAHDGDGSPALFVQAGAEAPRHRVSALIERAPRTLDELIRDEGGEWARRIGDALPGAGAGTALGADGDLLAPLLAPGTIAAIGLNYLDHCREFGTEPPPAPIVFVKLGSSIAAPGQPVEWSTSVTDAVDWEAELAVVIGRAGRDIPAERALEHVFGYTIVNDVTARDVQKAEPQWVRAKSLDTFCPLGPVVVAADEIPDPQVLGIRSRVNGETMQDSNTAEMIFGVAELIARLSRSLTLRPGDVIATGTPLGVGAFREPPRFLGEGDVVEVEIDGIGTLTNEFRARPGSE